MDIKFRWYRFVPTVLVMGMIFYLSHQPAESLALPDIAFLDKLIHALVYGVLAASVWYGIPEQVTRTYPWRVWGGVVLFCFLYALSDEFHQSFIPGREPDKLDIVADMFGAVMVSLVYVWKYRRPGGKE